MSYQLKVMRDYPVGFWPLNENSGSVAYDISGAGNHGEYTGTLKHGLPPIIPIGGEGRLLRIDNVNDEYITITPLNDYTGKEGEGFFGTYPTSDNEFSIELWVSLDNVLLNNSKTILYDDPTSGNPRIIIGAENGIIYFIVYDSSEDYVAYEAHGYINYQKKSLHVVAVYSVDSISLYIDGALMQTTSLPSNFKFAGTPISDNPPVSFKIMPPNCIVNGLALYRYSLSQQTILSHYSEGNTQIPLHQVAKINNGKVFDLNATKLYESFIYTYPADKTLESFVNSTNSDYIYYDQSNKNLKFYETSTESTIILEDTILIPNGVGITSKIEWRGDSGITVESSSDGENYNLCNNGGTISYYNDVSFSNSGILYLKITLDKTNHPEFSFLSLIFYRDKTIFSDNGGGKFYVNPNEVSAEVSLGTLNYPTLSRHQNNGIRVESVGFTISPSVPTNTIEMFFTHTPFVDPINSCSLIYSTGQSGTVSFSWDDFGDITKTNINKFYVNGVDLTSETNIYDIFIPGQMYHVVFVVEEIPEDQEILFNYNPDDLIYGVTNLYNNLIIYEGILSESDVEYNYNLWIGGNPNILVDGPITVDEKNIKIDDVDWVVVQST